MPTKTQKAERGNKVQSWHFVSTFLLAHTHTHARAHTHTDDRHCLQPLYAATSAAQQGMKQFHLSAAIFPLIMPTLSPCLAALPINYIICLVHRRASQSDSQTEEVGCRYPSLLRQWYVPLLMHCSPRHDWWPGGGIQTHALPTWYAMIPPPPPPPVLPPTVQVPEPTSRNQWCSDKSENPHWLPISRHNQLSFLEGTTKTLLYTCFTVFSVKLKGYATNFTYEDQPVKTWLWRSFVKALLNLGKWLLSCHQGQLGLADCKCIEKGTESMCYKPGVWSLTDMGVNQAERVQ